MAKGKVTHTIQIERLGQLHTWTMRDEPFKAHANLRRNYERGFRKRTEDFNQGILREPPKVVAKAETVGDAWAQGYADAMMQERGAGKVM